MRRALLLWLLGVPFPFGQAGISGAKGSDQRLAFIAC
jgi:hypothetical protein